MDGQVSVFSIIDHKWATVKALFFLILMKILHEIMKILTQRVFYHYGGIRRFLLIMKRLNDKMKRENVFILHRIGRRDFY